MICSAGATLTTFNGIIRTDTSGQIRARTDASTGATANVFTRGWQDGRGKLS